MGLFDKLKQLLGGRPQQQRRPEWCPQCGARYAWDGSACQKCNYVGAAVNPPQRVATASQPASGGRASAPVKHTSLDGLHTDKFQPLSVEQATEAVNQTANFQSAYLDPLNVIPDENLPRIQVINRTMVGLGLISAEELARIHEVGKQMDDLRGTQAGFARKAEAAVQRSRQQRERRKQELKEAAEQRKKERAAAIEERRRTDIVFLGRGVSKGLADRRSNVEELQANGLPILSTPAEIAGALSLTIPRLRWLAFDNIASRKTHYITFSVPKKSGGQRQLAAPHQELARTQYWILENILQKLPLHDAAHGFVTGRSILTNAQPHVGADIVVNADLSDFFPTINVHRIMGVFRSMGYSPAAATVFALLCTESPRREMTYDGVKYYAATGPRSLPQGACTSPALSNLTARRLDARLNGIAIKLKWEYSRYADDMTFSTKGEHAEKVGYLLARIRHICADESFSINEKKTRILRNNTAQTVTGVVVNDRAGAPRKLIRRIRAILHRAQFEGLDRQNREEHPHFESWLLGNIAFVHMLNPQQAKPLFDAFHRLPR